jgi:hypothetical protein
MIGDFTKPEYTRPPVARVNRLGPRKAAALTLAAYLKKVEFFVYGGDSEDRKFKLKDVKDQWPNAKIPKVFPSASIVESGPSGYDAHSFTPIALEDTIGQYDCMIGKPEGSNATVLFKESELDVQFQVDFRLSLQADREAIEAAISAVFNPSEERVGVLLEGPEQYYSRSFRFTLLDTDFMDAGENAYENEWRIRCVVQCEGDIVSLKLATLLPPQNPCIEVTDPNDPEE